MSNLKEIDEYNKYIAEHISNKLKNNHEINHNIKLDKSSQPL